MRATRIRSLSHRSEVFGNALDAPQPAAAQESATTAPPAVRSLVAARSSLAHAVAGDLTSFHRTREDTLPLLDTPPDMPLPRWTAYIDRIELDAITGRGLVVLAEQLPQQRHRLLRHAERLLHARANTSPDAPPQRSALRHGAWLSLAHHATGDLDLAVDAARLALRRLPAVSSARSVALLRRPHDELTPAGPRSPAVRDLLNDLRRLPTPS
ncbi:hypothetical protein AB0B88_29540 [Micromonospora haikouensis]|uniref:hypothetical protein n=1 Tax=Micromonospora haikouensis TaxID=686309 RepID=UPI0033C70983